MTETLVKNEYERVTVPKFRQIVKKTGVDLDPGTYFESYRGSRLRDREEESKKSYANCEACAVGTLAAFHSQLDPEKLSELSLYKPTVLHELGLPFPISYLAGLEHGFEGWDRFEGITTEAEELHVQGKWRAKINTNGEDFKNGVADGRRIRKAYNEGRL